MFHKKTNSIKETSIFSIQLMDNILVQSLYYDGIFCDLISKQNNNFKELQDCMTNPSFLNAQFGYIF